MSDIRELVLEKYSAKVYRNRKQHVITVGETESNEVLANVRTIPGIITQRGCCFARLQGCCTWTDGR